MTKAERAAIKRIAERDGISEEDAATQLLGRAVERRVRMKSGRGPAKVFQMRKK